MDDYRAASLHGWSSVATDWAQLTYRIDRQLQAAADWMIHELALEPGERVLELAGGPGTVSMMAARAVSPGGHVIYSDFAEPMVDAARERLQGEGAPGVEYRVIDAETIDLTGQFHAPAVTPRIVASAIAALLLIPIAIRIATKARRRDNNML